MALRHVLPIAVAAALAAAAPAAAQEPAKPAPGCGLSLTDAVGDATSQIPAQARPIPAALDITRLFFDHAPGRAGATTVNIGIKDLSTTLPTGATGLNWTVQWTSPTGPVRFVRAVVDYAGTTLFEFGEVVPPIGGLVLPRFEPRGVTTGKLHTGPDGVITIAIPDTWDGAPGTLLTEGYAQASEGRQVVPNAVSTPTRGLSQPADRAPNVDETPARWLVKGCPPPAA